MTETKQVARSSRTFAATYGGSKCRAITTDGSYFGVILSEDPGYGSMVFGRIHRSCLVLLAEIDPDTL